MSIRTFALLFSLGCAVLTAISWLHSWPALAAGRQWFDLGGGLHSNPWLDALQFATLSGLFALYLSVLIRWRRFQLNARTLALMGIAPGLLAFAALPANSNDSLFYVAMGRILVVHGANPYSHTYSEFQDDFSAYFGWDLPMPYGPVSLPPLMLAGWLSTSSIVLSIFALKLVWLLVHLCNCAVVYRVLTRKGADAAFGLFLFGFSPLILLEQVANGHNDGLMVLGGLLAISAVQRGRAVAALLLALCAAFVKIPGAMFWAAILVFLIRQGEWRRAAIGAAASAGLVVLTAAVFFDDRSAVLALTDSASPLLSTNSFHHLLISFVAEYGPRFGIAMELPEIFSVDRWMSSAVLLGFCVWRATYIRTFESLLCELAHLFLALMVAHAIWFMPWYVTWVVPLAALTASEGLRWGIVAYSGSALMLYGFPRYLITQAPFHQAWAAIRIFVAHAPVLALATRWIAGAASGKAARPGR